MNKELLTNQLNIVKNLPPGESFAFTVEGAGVLQAFVKARSTQPNLSPAEKALHTKINTLLNTWNNNDQPKPNVPKVTSPEKRSQLVLRQAIDKVQNAQFQQITEEEIKLIRATCEVFTKRDFSENDPNSRLKELLQNTLQKMEQHKSEMVNIQDKSIFDAEIPAGPTEQSLKIINDLMANDTFKDIQLTPMRNVEDIELDLNVRVYEFDGETAISGDIPNDVLVKVANGGITVNGFVSGYVVAENNITINGNIQGGGLITNQGSIRLERSLMGAALIAKRGSITCNHLESPAWAFAWNDVNVNGPCMAGVITAGNMNIEGKVAAAELRSCGRIKAKSLETSSRSETIIYLANQINCEDYNRRIPDKLKEQSRQVAELTKSIATAEEADRYTHHLIHNSYRTGLFYLLGGTESASTAVDLQGKQLKSLYLSQLIAFAESVSKFYTQVYAAPDEFGMDTVNEFRENTNSTFKIVKNDIEAIPEDFGATHRRYLIDRAEEFLQLNKLLYRDYNKGNDNVFLTTTFAKAVSKWRGDLGDFDREARELIQAFGLKQEILDRMEHQPETLEEFLDTTVKEKRDSAVASEIQRAKSPLIKLLQKAADRYKRNIEQNHSSVKKFRAELSSNLKILEEDAVVKFAQNIPGACSLQTENVAKDVIITASQLSRTGKDTAMAKVIVIDNPINSKTTFHLKDNMVQRQA